MGQHGLINWADDDKACYRPDPVAGREGRPLYRALRSRATRPLAGRNTRSLDEAARTDLLVRLLPRLRGMVSQMQPLYRHGARDTSECSHLSTAWTPPAWRRLAPPVRIISCAPRSSRCMWIGIRRMSTFETLVEKLESGIVQYRADYTAYYEACKQPDSPADARPEPDRDPDPGPGADRLGQEQERKPGDGRVLIRWRSR